MYYPLISSMNKAVVYSYTSRTTAFASATGIIDTTILGALNTFDLGLISNGLDAKMKALYPFVGGTASTHKYNFMDARDLDVAFRLQFNGGWTHSSNGAKPNGTNAYANTYLNPVANSLTTSSAHLAYYARTMSTTADPAEIANYTDGSSAFVLQTKGTGTDNRYFYSFALRAVKIVTSSPIGLIGGSSISNTRRDVYHNGISVGNNTITDTATLGNYPLYIGAGNIQNTSVSSYSDAQSSFASIGLGLTSAEFLIYYNLIQTMQTTLSRQV